MVNLKIFSKKNVHCLFKAHSHSLQEQMHFVVEYDDDSMVNIKIFQRKMFIVLLKAHSHSLREQTHFIVEDDSGSDTEPIESDNDNEVIVVSCA